MGDRPAVPVTTAACGWDKAGWLYVLLWMGNSGKYDSLAAKYCHSRLQIEFSSHHVIAVEYERQAEC